ncbi:MAG TPA: ATP-dependent RNA helicase HrpA [Opitutaceae bacterium]|nr:ATP-dependent RNA helicase HrpA [Opitutaceae bacterium]
MSSAAKKPFPFRLEFPPELPISARAEEITAAIAANSVVILAGETGSGKTTQIPKMCLAAGRGLDGRIVCTQPRRVAALSISRRVAEELGVQWGREVGCKVRFNDQTSADTLIKFVTDGMLLAELQGDPMLREYDTIIIDEAHERSLNIDFLLGHLRTLRFKRPELKILITSATIDTAAFSEAFDGAPVVLVEGRTFPVEVIYAPLDELGRDYSDNDENEETAERESVASARAEALHYIDGTVEAVERIARESGSGDVLAFLPSERDIREARDLLEGRLRPGSRGAGVEIVPLFGRLSNAEQQRVFAPTQRRKVVLATNIAETSLTIPGIRFVVDAGLARISRYSPQSRTRRLPIEEIAQSSAEQRKGRAGRVAEGVCIRLYSEKDFLERPRFTQPEIQRANLADVILRMKAFGLGDIERFPFINQPATKAIRAGYALLEELGAIGEETACPAGGGAGAVDAGPALLTRHLTSVGEELARLPVDPTVGRMILQARAEKALREVAVIAAGLSIQDPRERPLDKQAQADAAHRRFSHPDSDFLSLLNIWNSYHDEFETLSQAKLRRFCRDHFLSYPRMREWRDIHGQLLDVLEERPDFKLTSALAARPPAPDAPGNRGASAGGRSERRAGSERGAPPPRESARRGAVASGPARDRDSAESKDPLAFGTPAYRAIHRSILAGLLGNIALLDEENGGYKATHDRRVVLFPGSVLFRRDESRKKGPPTRPPDAGAANARRSPRWIMAAEIVETTRLYARTCARLDPQWALELGGHLVRVAHSEPFWNEEAGRVMVRQRTRLYGLELESRAVGYGRINPVHATEIFLREGLVNDTVRFPLDFLAHNRRVREQVEDLLTRARDSGYLNLDEAAYRFYASRLRPASAGGEAHAAGGSHCEDPAPGGESARSQPTAAAISSVAELVDLVRDRRTTEPRFLFMSAEDLRDPNTLAVDAAEFPPALPLENRALPLNYAYKPGQPDDGVTVSVSVREAEALTPARLDWAVPGHLEAKVEHYLRALPKELRRGFVPLGETAKSLTAQLGSRDRLTDRRESLPEALAAEIAERFRIAIDPAVWADKPPPDHLRVRIRVVDNDGRELCASRSLEEVRAALLAQSREASQAVAREEPAAWRSARAQWETPEYRTWSFDAVPERVLVAEPGGAPVYAFPGLKTGADGVARRLFKSPEEAAASTRAAVSSLLERELGHDLMWTQRDLRSLREVGPLASTLAPLETLQEQAFASIRRWAIDADRLEGVWSAAAFSRAAERAKADLRGLVPRLVDVVREILMLRQELLVVADPPPAMAATLGSLLPADFLARTHYPRLAHLPRYLKALKVRAGRWRKNPGKDAERTSQIAPYERQLAQLEQRRTTAGAESISVSAVERLRWLIEEFRVSLFAQEIGTAEPISAVKLDRLFAELGPDASRESRNQSPSATAKPIVATPLPDAERKPGRVKNLGALDKLFGR